MACLGFRALAPVVQKVDSAIHWISIRETNCAIHLSKNLCLSFTARDHSQEYPQEAKPAGSYNKPNCPI